MNLKTVACCALTLWLAAPSARAQSESMPTTLTGLAVDSTGLALPGVTVTLTTNDPARNEPLVQFTDASGTFTFDQLESGSYTLAFSLQGFQDRQLDVTVPAPDTLKIVLPLAGFSESVTVKPDSRQMSEPAPNTTTLDEKQLAALPLKSERFEDALPLLPGVVRGPDGLLNMNGARADQSALVVNGVNMSDPVTGDFAMRLPIEAIETITLHSGASVATFGNATGGVTDVVVRAGQDRLAVQVQNVMPRLRFQEDGIRGIDSFTPRVRVSGPIRKGRAWFSDAASYRFVRSRVDELHPLAESEQVVESFDALSQTDVAIGAGHHLAATLVWFPGDIDNAAIDTLHPFDATPDIEQRGWGGDVSVRSMLSDRTTLSTSLASREYDVDVAPKHRSGSQVTVSGVRSNYFNRFDRSSRRDDLKSTIAHYVPHRAGSHLMKAGGQLAHTTYDGIDASLPVTILRADGAAIQRIDFIGDPGVGAENWEVAAFVDDEWDASERVTLRAGGRYSHEGIAGEHTLASRLDATVRPFADGRTVIRAGAGRLYDKLPLSADDFERRQSRRISDLDGLGAVAGTVTLDARVSPAGLRTPGATAFNAEVDHRMTPRLTGRISYRHVRGFNQLVVDPREDLGMLQLSNRGRTRVHEFEATVRRQFREASFVNVSYVYASTKGNLNDFVSLFGNLRDPILHPDEFARQAFDVPNRFLVWGVLNFPHDVVVSPTVEYRTGFPYSVVNQHQLVVGSRNGGGRFPDLFTFDLGVTKDVVVAGQQLRVGVQFFNLTDHFNPRDVQNNTGSPLFGTFANSADRQVRAKLVFLF